MVWCFHIFGSIYLYLYWQRIFHSSVNCERITRAGNLFRVERTVLVHGITLWLWSFVALTIWHIFTSNLLSSGSLSGRKKGGKEGKQSSICLLKRCFLFLWLFRAAAGKVKWNGDLISTDYFGWCGWRMVRSAVILRFKMYRIAWYSVAWDEEGNFAGKWCGKVLRKFYHLLHRILLSSSSSASSSLLRHCEVEWNKLKKSPCILCYFNNNHNMNWFQCSNNPLLNLRNSFPYCIMVESCLLLFLCQCEITIYHKTRNYLIKRENEREIEKTNFPVVLSSCIVLN